jgi:hypothetical protein
MVIKVGMMPIPVAMPITVVTFGDVGSYPSIELGPSGRSRRRIVNAVILSRNRRRLTNRRTQLAGPQLSGPHPSAVIFRLADSWCSRMKSDATTTKRRSAAKVASATGKVNPSTAKSATTAKMTATTESTTATAAASPCRRTKQQKRDTN